MSLFDASFCVVAILLFFSFLPVKYQFLRSSKDNRLTSLLSSLKMPKPKQAKELLKQVREQSELASPTVRSSSEIFEKDFGVYQGYLEIFRTLLKLRMIEGRDIRIGLDSLDQQLKNQIQRDLSFTQKLGAIRFQILFLAVFYSFQGWFFSQVVRSDLDYRMVFATLVVSYLCFSLGIRLASAWSFSGIRECAMRLGLLQVLTQSETPLSSLAKQVTSLTCQFGPSVVKRIRKGVLGLLDKRRAQGMALSASIERLSHEVEQETKEIEHKFFSVLRVLQLTYLAVFGVGGYLFMLFQLIGSLV